MKFKTILIAAVSAVAFSACAMDQAPAEKMAQAGEMQGPPAPPSQYRPNTLNPRDAEKMKIHEMAMECIKANNVSAACNEIVLLDARQGKNFIQQETGQR